MRGPEALISLYVLVIITDKLKSYGAAKREMLPGVEHRQSRSLTNRCEHSHRPTRQREYRMQGFKSPWHGVRMHIPHPFGTC
jgi:putative transposase